MPWSGRIRASAPPLICSSEISWQGCGACVTSCSPVRTGPTGDSSSNPRDPIHYEFNLGKVGAPTVVRYCLPVPSRS